MAVEQLQETHRVIYRNRTNGLEVTFRDGAGQLVNDPGATYRVTARTGWSAAGVTFSRTASQSSPGKAVILIQPGDTSGLAPPVVLVYEVDVTETGGRRTTIELGTMLVKQEVSA